MLENDNAPMNKVGLTLSGGGARGAYQAGVMRAIYDITKLKHSPFNVISGVSAGALNAMALASEAGDFQAATQKVSDTWLNLSIDKIFKTDAITAVTTIFGWVSDLALGEYLPTKKATHILDTSPLRQLLSDNLDLGSIERNIQAELLHGIALSTTDYRSGKCVTFFDGDSSIQEWDRNSGVGKRCQLTIDHMMASSAIPIFFPPVRIGMSDYGDGGIAQSAALSPVLRMGAQRIVAIGLERPPGNENCDPVKSTEALTLSEIAGTLLNSLFIKSMRGDIIRLQHTNKLLAMLTPEELATENLDIRQVPALFITPSEDLGKIDANQLSKFPFALRRLLKAIGFNDRRAWDLLSYLAFDKEYAQALINLGYKDGIAHEKEILAFLNVG